MKREDIFQTTLRCTEAPGSTEQRALYAYAVLRGFPSPEVLYNKLSELHGQSLPPETRYEELPEEAKIGLTIFRGVAQLLEPFADEPIEAFNPDGVDQPHAASTDGAAAAAPAAGAAAMSDGPTPTQPEKSQKK